MKTIIKLLLILGVLTLTNAQMHDGGHYNPDSLDTITVTGIVSIENTGHQPTYYLDIDSDNNPDYHLNFGPYWYEPDSSNAVRPENGERITVSGGLHEMFNEQFSTIVVYELNGEFWREPFYAYWNDMGEHFGGGMGHGIDNNGYAYGFMHDSLESVSLSGVVLIDTTFVMEHFYLDTNNDTIPEYFLNFGPWWYEPESGIERPANGDEIEITGGLMEGHYWDMVVVYELNGEVWRDSTFFAGHRGGGWIHRDMDSSVTFHNPYDYEDQMRVEPGWYQSGGQHDGAMMSDSLFFQLLELYPEDMPNLENEHPFMGFEIGGFSPDGSNMMMNGGRMGGRMSFINGVHFQFRYNSAQLLNKNVNENTIKAKYWNDETANWDVINNVEINTKANQITFSNSEIPNYIIFTADYVTSVNQTTISKPIEFTLKQNYPNPFNPSTSIEYQLTRQEIVSLKVFNILGKEIATLVNELKAPGVYNVKFDGTNLASGIYFYELRVDGRNIVRKMNLLK